MSSSGAASASATRFFVGGPGVGQTSILTPDNNGVKRLADFILQLRDASPPLAHPPT